MYEELLALTGAALFGQPCGITADQEIKAEAKKQAVSALIGTDLSVLSQNMKVLHEHLKLHELLTGAGIPYVILKGYASSAYYPRPDMRTLGDVDFLVRSEDLDRTDALLKEQGYTGRGHETDHHLTYRHNGIELELHWTLNGLPEDAAGDRIREYMADAIPDAVLTGVHRGQLMLPSPFHHGFISILHIARHMTTGGMGLRHLCDWAVFVGSVPDFPGMFQAAFEETGLWEFAKQLTALCRKYLGLPGQEWTGDWPEEFMEQFMGDILDAGNFGKKKGVAHANILLDNVNTSGKAGKSSKTGAVTRNIIAKAKVNWPPCRKHRILLPIGCIYVCGQYLNRVRKGKRRMINRQSFKEADRRRDLCAKFKLFEKE